MTWYYGRRINSWTHSRWFGYWQSSRFRCSHITSTDWSCAQWLWAYIIKQILLHHFIAHGFKSLNCFDCYCLELWRRRSTSIFIRKSRQSNQYKNKNQQDKLKFFWQQWKNNTYLKSKQNDVNKKKQKQSLIVWTYAIVQKIHAKKYSNSWKKNN